MTALQELRSMMPKRRLTRSEGFGLAERQATRLLRLSAVTESPVPSAIVAGLPFIQVAVRALGQSSGATDWVKPHWIVLLNGSESAGRQRFSLGHELKHVLDHSLVAVAYGDVANRETHRYVERICEYFSACLWMPRPWVKSAYANGVQDTVDLADLFDVSPQAMHVRLIQLGLVDRYERCSGINNRYLRSLPVSPLELAA